MAQNNFTFMKQKKRKQEDTANKNVSDILYQMIIDEQRYGLDKKTAQLLEDGKDKNFMMQTRSDLLKKVAEDLERARKMTQEPNFKFKEMKDLLSGKTIEPEDESVENPFDSGAKIHEAMLKK